MLLTAVLIAPAAVAAKVNVVATTSTFADLVNTVVGDHVQVSFVAPPKFNVHFIEPRPSDVFKVKKADAFAHAGLDLELWSRPLRDAAGNRDVMKGAEGDLDLSRGISLLEVPQGTVSRAAGDIHLYGNPHYWTDPANARIIVDTIAAKLSELDSAHAADFKANALAFRSKLDTKIAEWQSKLDPFKGAKLIGYHNEWPYLMRFAGLTMEMFLEPKPGIPPGPKQIAALTDYAKTAGPAAIVQTVYYSDKAAKSLSANTGVPVITLSQNVGDVPESKDYISMVEYNVNTLAKALAGRS
jgi:ABC-type Zn uptake system ZnuABC Zn-binding protein ZnuA